MGMGKKNGDEEGFVHFGILTCLVVALPQSFLYCTVDKVWQEAQLDVDPYSTGYKCGPLTLLNWTSLPYP